jgi:hypothetical protein
MLKRLSSADFDGSLLEVDVCANTIWQIGVRTPAECHLRVTMTYGRIMTQGEGST